MKDAVIARAHQSRTLYLARGYGKYNIAPDGRRRGRARGAAGAARSHSGVRRRGGAAPVDVQVQVANGAVGFHHRRSRRQGGRRNCAKRVRAALVASGLALRRRAASPSISPPPTCPRKAATTICRSRSAVMAAIGAIPADALDGYAVHRRTRARRGRSARSPACCRRRSPPTRAASASSVPPPAGPRRPGPRPRGPGEPRRH